MGGNCLYTEVSPVLPVLKNVITKLNSFLTNLNGVRSSKHNVLLCSSQEYLSRIWCIYPGPGIESGLVSLKKRKIT
jgi:hypothetical protein